MAHLKSVHNLVEATVEPTKPSVKSMFSAQAPLPKQRQDRITKALAELVVDGLHPISLVDNEAFRNFMRVVEPKYQRPASKTIKEVICSMYINVVNH